MPIDPLTSLFAQIQEQNRYGPQRAFAQVGQGITQGTNSIVEALQRIAQQKRQERLAGEERDFTLTRDEAARNFTETQNRLNREADTARINAKPRGFGEIARLLELRERLRANGQPIPKVLSDAIAEAGGGEATPAGILTGGPVNPTPEEVTREVQKRIVAAPLPRAPVAADVAPKPSGGKASPIDSRATALERRIASTKNALEYVNKQMEAGNKAAPALKARLEKELAGLSKQFDAVSERQSRAASVHFRREITKTIKGQEGPLFDPQRPDVSGLRPQFYATIVDDLYDGLADDARLVQRAMDRLQNPVFSELTAHPFEGEISSASAPPAFNAATPSEAEIREFVRLAKATLRINGTR